MCKIKRKKIVIYLQGHYSIKKSAAMMGLGTDNIFSVKSDKKGKMIAADLDDQINKAIGQV
jgi:glutamate/tyrosine decarboxylase-like PLP-dependent enzyme